MATEYSTEKSRQIKNKYKQCIKIINEEKIKSQPDILKIKKHKIELDTLKTIKNKEL